MGKFPNPTGQFPNPTGQFPKTSCQNTEVSKYNGKSFRIQPEQFPHPTGKFPNTSFRIQPEKFPNTTVTHVAGSRHIGKTVFTTTFAANIDQQLTVLPPLVLQSCSQGAFAFPKDQCHCLLGILSSERVMVNVRWRIGDMSIHISIHIMGMTFKSLF